MENEIKAEVKDKLNAKEQEKVLENIQNKEIDFEINNYRFIHHEKIDKIMKEELLSDTYTLGCCNAWFIAEITKIPIEVIEKGQKEENFELLGELMVQKIDLVQEKMVSYDGYGHHFGHYDGNEFELKNYYYFKVN